MTAKEIKRTLQSEFVRTLRKPFVDAVKALVKVDERFVPSEPGTSLYIRPFLFGTDGIPPRIIILPY